MYAETDADRISAMFANAARFADAYHTAIAPLCASTGLPPAAADILLFLANNPGCETAARSAGCGG